MSNDLQEMVDNLLGETFNEDEIPAYPGQIFWYDGEFITTFPYAPLRMVEVRFRDAPFKYDGDFIIYEARSVDTSNPENVYGSWKTWK